MEADEIFTNLLLYRFTTHSLPTYSRSCSPITYKSILLKRHVQFTCFSWLCHNCTRQGTAVSQLPLQRLCTLWHAPEQHFDGSALQVSINSPSAAQPGVGFWVGLLVGPSVIHGSVQSSGQEHGSSPPAASQLPSPHNAGFNVHTYTGLGPPVPSVHWLDKKLVWSPPLHVPCLLFQLQPAFKQACKLSQTEHLVPPSQ